MYPSLTLIDNFLVDEKALEIRSEALEAGFKDHHFMGGTYQGTGTDYIPPEIEEALAKFFGREVKTAISAFRLGHKDTTLHVNIHADNVISQWAGVYYMNLPLDCRGGTAFYQMADTGWDRMPTQEQLDSIGKSLDWLTDKWTDEKAWYLISLAGMKFNRMIVYPALHFHSRYPLVGWGEETDPEHARLVFTTFFDVL